MKVTVDKAKCIGCGLCTAVAPEIFELGADGKSTVKKQPENEAEEAKVKNAAESCPTNAIVVEE